MTSLRNPGSGRPLTVKVGGARGIGGADLLHDLANHARSGALTVVHGGSDGVTRLQERLGRPARFLTSPTGQVSRRTDREDLEAFAMATALVNRTLVEELLARGVSALGLSGLDGALVRGAGDLRDPEVDDLGLQLPVDLGDEHVVGAQVAMQHGLLVYPRRESHHTTPIPAWSRISVLQVTPSGDH